MAAGALNPKVNDDTTDSQFPESQIVRSGKANYVDAMIENGGSLSAAIAVRGAVVAILIPAAWTAADITFQGSVSGSTYADIYDSVGATERKIASANIPTAATKWITLSLADWLPYNYIKIRSGTSAVPANQGGARTIRVALAG